MQKNTHAPAETFFDINLFMVICLLYKAQNSCLCGMHTMT